MLGEGIWDRRLAQLRVKDVDVFNIYGDDNDYDDEVSLSQFTINGARSINMKYKHLMNVLGSLGTT